MQVNENPIGGVFGDIWDKALGVFDKVADFELGKIELDLARDVQLFKQAQAAEDFDRQRQFSSATAGNTFGIAGGNTMTLLLIGGAALIGVLLIARR